jgi:signal transduction histidine kinase
MSQPTGSLNNRSLNQLLLELILWRLFLPLLLVWLLAIGGIFYFGVESLKNQQRKTVQSVARMVESHLDQSGRILDAVGRVAEELSFKDINVFMGSTLKAYKHFETIYYLGDNNRIKLMVPFEPTYIGLDMSRLSDIKLGTENDRIAISRPFISLRSGLPTVYLTIKLSLGGYVVGELNLGAVQDEIVRLRGLPGTDSISIIDQSGTLLAHPDFKQVQQQTNLDSLQNVLNISDGSTIFYKFSEAMVLASVAKVDRVEWVVVEQAPVSMLFGPYVLTIGITLLLTMIIWLALIWNLRKKLNRNVVAPLVQLSQSTSAIAVGDFSQVDSLAAMPVSFNEISKLADDFMYMSNALQAHQTELSKAQDELVRQEKLAILGRLSGTVSHELRNPLGVISNAVYLLKRKLAGADETVLEYLEIAQQEVENSTRIIGSLLDFARTKPALQKQMDARTLIECSLKKCVIPESVSVQVEISSMLKPLLIDPQQVEQVLQNLITNGIQAMPEGGSICISAKPVQPLKDEGPEYGFVGIEVRDSGVGIEPENMEKLFQPLFTTKPKGIGLGLVVCKNLVEGNGGRIEVASSLGVGTTFRLLLPVADHKLVTPASQ